MTVFQFCSSFYKIVHSEFWRYRYLIEEYSRGILLVHISSSSAFYPPFRVLSSIPRFILNSVFYPQFRVLSPIPVPHSGSVFRYRIPVPYSGSAFRFRIPVPHSGSAFYPYPWCLANSHIIINSNIICVLQIDRIQHVAM